MAEQVHAILSASGSSRWLACPPSAQLELQFPRSESTYADEGTAAHELCEVTARYRLGEIDKKAYTARLRKLKTGQYYNTEMKECADDYGDFILETVNAAKELCPDAFAEIEVTDLDFSEWAPDGFGTGDCIIVSDDLLEIIDFKYGKGVRVEAVNNSQMMLYALGAINRYGDLYDIKRIRMSIIQPRINREPSTSESDVNALLYWAENVVKPRAALAAEGKGEYAPGADTCKFCRAKEVCRARAEKNLALFDDTPDALLITPSEAGEILERAEDIRAWLTDLENLVMKTLFEGVPVTGWKLVEGRSNRKFVDDLQVAEAMLAAGFEEAILYERNLITLTAMEKAFGKKAVAEILEDLIIKPAGKPTLAPAKDKRPEFTPDALIIDAFDEE